MIEWMVDSRRHRPSPIGASHPSHLTFIKEDAKNDDSIFMTSGIISSCLSSAPASCPSTRPWPDLRAYTNPGTNQAIRQPMTTAI